MTPLHAVERELAENAASLRALALDLVGRDHADDLVQETALRALRSPPPRPHGLAAWLATVLRRLASSHRRHDARRRAREHRVARPEHEPAADEPAARRDSLRAVTAALFALPDPYQSVLMLRYFDGLSPSAIAGRLGVPVATVKSRLQRGLAHLREVLDRDRRGDWRKALLVATGAAVPAAGITTGLGVLWMAQTAKFVAAAAVMLVGATILWQLGSQPAAPLVGTSATASAPATAAPVAADTESQAQPAPAREVVAATPFPGVDLQHPFAYRLEVRVVDRFGLPIAGRKVSLAPRGCAPNQWPDATGDDGLVVLEWRGRAAQQVVSVQTDGPLRELQLTAGAPARIELLAAGDGQVAGKAFRLRLIATGSNSEYSLLTDDGESQLEPVRGMHPERLFADAMLAPGTATEPAGVAVLSRLPLVSYHAARINLVDFEPKLSFAALDRAGPAPTILGGVTFTPADTAPTTGSIAGMVYDEAGTPCPDEPVACGPDPDHPVVRTTTDERGAYSLDAVQPGNVVVRAGGGDRGLGISPVLVTAGASLSAAVHLRRDLLLQGTALGDGGEPLKDWWVEFETLDGGHADRAQVAADGTFVLTNLPPRPGRVWLHRKLEDLPALLLPGVMPGAAPLLLDLAGDAAPAGGVLLRLPPAGNGQPRRARARLWQEDSGFGATLVAGDDDGLRLGGLRAGFYRVELHLDGIGGIDLGRHWCDGRGELDLGTPMLPEPGLLRLGRRPPDTTIELCQRRPGGDVRAEHGPDTDDEIRLPAGDWLLFWRTGDAAPRVHPFRVDAGAVTDIDLGAR